MTASTATPMRFHVDAWEPDYGSSLTLEATLESSARTVLDIEVEPDDWAPVDPSPVAPPQAVLFVDGVRRLDANVWIDDVPGPNGRSAGASPALAASYASGVVCCCAGRAHIVDTQVRRGLFTTASHATDVVTRAGTYPVVLTAQDPATPLVTTATLAVQKRMSQLEEVVAGNARSFLAGHGLPAGSDLLVVDGPLRGRAHLERTVGYIKSHQSAYLPGELNRVVAGLRAGQRTPVFMVGTNWDRMTWYLRLPGPDRAPWAGVVRLEASGELSPLDAVALANLTQVTLGRFASSPHKDSRAPQNLVPIAGLERELRHRLGDTKLMNRALRAAAAGV